MSKRIAGFWVKNGLESLALTLGCAAVFLVLYALGGSEYGGVGEAVTVGLAVFPYYVFLVGLFIISMSAAGYFQQYFSLLVSMSATRRAAVLGILVFVAAMDLGTLGFMWLSWSLTKGDIAQSGLAILPFLAGVLFLISAFLCIMGCVMVRWGRIGMIIMVLVYMVLGGCAGFGVAVSGQGLDKIMKLVTDVPGYMNIMLPVGVAVYLAAGAFAVSAMSRAEVRR